MDWPSLLIGALAGGMVGIVLQNMLFPAAERRWRTRRQRASYFKANTAWSQVEQLHPRLILLQAGWDGDNCFPEGSVVLRLNRTFKIINSTVLSHREKYSPEWLAAGHTDGEQVGIAAFSITRTSDEPSHEFEGRAHQLTLDVHRYRYFDFLVTHMMRISGNTEERKVLDALVGRIDPMRPTPDFPTPCSVGLSLLCEDGTRLLTVRRATSGGTGAWEGGKIFNAVGENTALRDFAAANRRLNETTPDVVARRGLFEEFGFSDDDIRMARVRLHSFAWASDLLDYKFFGVVETSLSHTEAEDRWRNAPDRSETADFELRGWPVRTSVECRTLLASIKEHEAQWSPEAVFCTIRSLITLRRITAREISQLLE